MDEIALHAAALGHDCGLLCVVCGWLFGLLLLDSADALHSLPPTNRTLALPAARSRPPGRTCGRWAGARKHSACASGPLS
jgi:hypothetical protein